VSGLSASELLPAAVGIALNPPAVVAVILMLSASRKKAAAFVLGWMAGLLVVGAGVLLLGDAGQAAGSPSTIGLVLKLVLGLALLGVAAWQWRRRPSAAEGDEAEGTGAEGDEVEGDTDAMPKWMRSLAGFSTGKSFATAALFAGLNPKTLALNVAGAVVIVEASLSVPAQAVALVLFVVVASLTVIAPLLYHVLAPGQAERRLASAQRWLVANNKAITATVLLLLGIMLVASGVQGLVAS
jgi:hypothetical protein